MNRSARLMLLLLGLFTVLSCSKEERDPCLQPRTTVLRAHSYRRADTGTAILDTLLPNPVFIPLSSGLTQYYYGGQRRIAAFGLSLSQVADSCRWVIRPDSATAVQDTLTFFYQRQLRFLSNACGYTHFYSLSSVTATRNALDSAVIGRGDVTTDANLIHLRLYY